MVQHSFDYLQIFLVDHLHERVVLIVEIEADVSVT